MSVTADTDQEEVARLVTKHQLLAVPVVDRNHRLLGTVTIDDVIDVIHEEATEDIHRLGGVSADETIFDPASKVVRRRLFWLLVNLPTAVLAASVVGLFEPSIQALAALAVFMPIVAGMGGNAGIQTFTVIVRAMALGDLTRPTPGGPAPGDPDRPRERGGRRDGRRPDRLLLEGRSAGSG